MKHGRQKVKGIKYGEVATWLTLDHDPEKRWPVYVGIDPGAKGAIAFLSPKSYKVFDMPTLVYKTSSGRNRTDFDLKSITNLFCGMQGFRGSVRAAVEVTQPQTSGFRGRQAVGDDGGGTFGKSAYNAYRSGMSYYMWPLFLLGKGFRVREVHPQTWKRSLGLLGYNKNASLKLARKLFPEAELHLKKFDGRAEALLIAHYLRSEDERGENGPGSSRRGR